ncbi:MAG: DMT family transporter [Candidatus Micrarchaeota archaeon]
MAFEIGILAAFGAMICWGLGDFFIQRSTRKIGDVQSLAWIGLIGAVLLLPFVIGDLQLLVVKQNLWFLAALGALGFAISLVTFEGFKQGKLSVVDVILEIELPITIAFGIVFLSETVSLIQLAIISFVFVGIVLVALPVFSLKESFQKLEKGALLAIVAALGMGAINFLTGVGAKTVSPFLVIWVPWVIMAVISLFIVWRREGFQNFFKNAAQNKKLIACESVLDTAAWMLFAIALVRHPVSITTAITESYPALAVLLGVWFNREKVQRHQLAGAGMAIVASICLGFLV